MHLRRARGQGPRDPEKMSSGELLRWTCKTRTECPVNRSVPIAFLCLVPPLLACARARSISTKAAALTQGVVLRYDGGLAAMEQLCAAL